MKKYVPDFLDYINFERGYSKNTISNYKRDLVQFFDFAKDSSVDRKRVSEYLNKLNNQGISPTSIMRKLATLKTFYHYLLAEGKKAVGGGCHAKN